MNSIHQKHPQFNLLIASWNRHTGDIQIRAQGANRYRLAAQARQLGWRPIKRQLYALTLAGGEHQWNQLYLQAKEEPHGQ